MATVAILGAGAMGSALATPAVTAGTGYGSGGPGWTTASWPSCGPGGPTPPASGSIPGSGPTTRRPWRRPRRRRPGRGGGQLRRRARGGAPGAPPGWRRGRRCCSAPRGSGGARRRVGLPGPGCRRPRQPAGGELPGGGRRRALQGQRGRRRAADGGGVRGRGRGARRPRAQALGTPAYRVEPSGDLAGVEAAAATKNIYAIAVGVCHGLTEAGGSPGTPRPPSPYPGRGREAPGRRPRRPRGDLLGLAGSAT